MKGQEHRQILDQSGETLPPLVSVLCIAYNHERYIAECIEGFLRQKTNFPFEILIHDDASTDSTRSIIERYAELHPVIKPIYQTTNQYSKGVKIIPDILLPQAVGTYIALCEGDDYWSDDFKLEKQMAVFRTQTNVALVETAALVLENGLTGQTLTKGGTRTFMFRKDLFRPAEIMKPQILYGDIYVRMMLGSSGRVVQLDDVTAVWRIHEGGVWGSRFRQESDAVFANKVTTKIASIMNLAHFGRTSYVAGEIAKLIVDLIRHFGLRNTFTFKVTNILMKRFIKDTYAR